MTIKELDGLNILLRHAQIDMQYGEGGSYNDNEGNFDKSDHEKALVGMRFINRLMLKKQHQMSAKRIAAAMRSGKISVTF